MSDRQIAAVLSACLLIFATPALAQSGRIFSGVPLPPSATPEARKSVADRPLISDRKALDALKANVARVLAPDLELAGEVTIVDGPRQGGTLGRFSYQTVLSVPVRFRATATLDADVHASKATLKQGTLMYRRIAPQIKGEPEGLEDWCGVGSTSTTLDDDGKPDLKMICIRRTADGGATVVTADAGHTKGDPFYNFAVRPLNVGIPKLAQTLVPVGFGYPVTFDAKSFPYDGPFPAMTAVAVGPADMTAELEVISVKQSNLGSGPWVLGSSFVWVLKKGTAEAPMSYSNEATDNYARIEPPYQILRMAWIDMVFKMEGGRLNYQGYIDLAAETPDLAPQIQRYDAAMAGRPPAPSQMWSLGALDIDPASLAIDDSAKADGNAVIALNGHIRQKVRLLDSLNIGLPGHFEAGDVVYATVFDGSYVNGAPYAIPGWCGPVHKFALYKGDLKPKVMACFSADDFVSAGIADYQDLWETLDGSTVFHDFNYYQNEFPYTLPRYEAVPPSPEDARTVLIHIHRRGDKGVEIKIAVKDTTGERTQRAWLLPFDGTGIATLDLWTRRLRIRRDGATAVTVTVEDGGLGLGLRAP